MSLTPGTRIGPYEVAESLATRMYYVGGETNDPAFYQRLQARLTEIDGAEGVLFYLAIPPSVYATVIERWLGVPHEALLGQKWEQLGFLAA